jgi:hypothetical protein
MCSSSYRETASRPAQMRLVALTTHQQHAKPPMPVGGCPAAQARRAGAAVCLQHHPICLHHWLPLDLAELALGFHGVDVEGGSSRGRPKRGDPNGLDRSRPRRHEGSRASHQPALEPATAIFSSPHPRLTSRWPWPCGAAGVPLFTPLATNIIRGRSLNPTKQSSHSLSFAHSPRLPTTISSAARGESRHAHFSPRS